MTPLLRRFRITTRVLALVVLAVSLLLVVMASALIRFDQQASASRTTAQAMRLSRIAMEAKFRSADAAGWQTGYAFDFNRGVPNAADDAVGQRKEFVASSAALSGLYAELAGQQLTPTEAGLLATARAAFDKFLQVDQQIVAGYRQGTRKSVATSNELASGASLEAFGAAAQATNDLADRIAARGVAAAQASVSSSVTGSRVVWLSGGVGLALEIVLTTLIVLSIARPMRALWAGLVEIASQEGNLSTRLPEGGGDELSLVASTFNTFADGMASIVRSVADRASALWATSGQLADLAGGLAGSAADASGRAAMATGAVSEISSNAQIAASGTRQMGAAIDEIARSTTEATHVTAQAQEVAMSVTDKMARLGDSSQQISEVVQVITSIAEQTNLLALNATIEAARAGDAGKGFAVVATEVKELAQETARATENISGRIGAIQTDTTAAMEAIAQITDVIGQINDLQTVVASAIEEQSTASLEMGRSIGEAAEGSTRIAEDVAAVADIADQTTRRVDDLQHVATDLATLSGELRRLTEQFHC